MTPTQRAAMEQCLQVLRPSVRGKFPQEQALEELAGYLSTLAQPAPVQEPETVSVYGVKSNGEVFDTGVKAPMPPRMKAKEMVREMFGPWEEDDGSDSDLCFAACEQFFEWLISQGWTAPQAQQPVAEPEVHDAKCPALTGGDCECSESPASVDKPWARFCGQIGRGPDAPYPGMIEAFELHYSQSFTDRDWRDEASVWAASWKAAKAHPAPQAQQPAEVPMLTEDEVEAVQEGIAVDDFAHDLVRRTERLVRQKAGLQ